MQERLERVCVPALDEILGVRMRLLDDGFVRVVDYMGSDQSVVQAARISYGSGTKHLGEDRQLIRYLLRHRHTTPFEMCEIKLHVRVPMDCWRQWIRHRTANVNEYSTRYSVAIDAAQRTAPNGWRLQSKTNRQGSEGRLDVEEGEHLSAEETQLHEQARAIYQERLSLGIAREQARKDLPLSTYTEAYWKIDLHNLLHFLSLRLDTHSQAEIRSYADVIGSSIVGRWCPLTWEAFVEYQLSGISLSITESRIIRALNLGRTDEAISIARAAGLLPKEGDQLKANRERSELEAKFELIGLSAPWGLTD
ncbi:MAG: FAD-dependent thymidylate synthase [Planctomycetota bacterium]|nr:FAD-dependent thymidylate synthase [Planctomycetota bacterium]